ncbi:NUDIX domain-containing protein [Qingshengfaniella alkalisoli]|uniref:NUDIX hydrolase n=1 Tax=Qingshengfaniella alkalisoli TaxID=2599296 RepID=A0A5B8J403_9RHOB|nr:NUDIX hydrolase [Qingshengfaniella alkalisoli]QDY71438.1 NUDIX hydrolase [Qingshengfaniella alkalisoli]
MRRFGERVVQGQRYEIRPGAYTIVTRGSNILLTHQMAPTPEFQLPGGGIDPGESPLQALHREVFEETGWRIRPVRRLTAYRRFVFMPDYDKWAEKVCIIYLSRAVHRLAPPSEDGHTAVWLSAGIALEVLAGEGDREILASVLDQSSLR